MSFRDNLQTILANGWLVHGQPLPSSRLTTDAKSVKVKDDKWITVNPNKGNGESDENEGRGQHVLIGNGGEIKAGLGGKYNGKTIGEIAKKPVKGKPYANQKKPKKPKEPKSPEPGAAGATGDPSGGISAGGSGTINQQEQNQNQNQNQPQNQGSPLDIFSEDEDSIKAHFTDEDGNLYSIYCVIDDGKITSIDVTGKHGDDVAYFSDFDNEWHKAQSFSDESLKKIKGELEDHLGVGGSGEEEPQSQKELPMKIDNQTDKKIDGTFIGEDGKEYSFGCDYKGNNIIYFSIRDDDGNNIAVYYGDDDTINAPFDDKDAVMAEKLKDALQKHLNGDNPGAGATQTEPADMSLDDFKAALKNGKYNGMDVKIKNIDGTKTEGFSDEEYDYVKTLMDIPKLKNAAKVKADIGKNVVFVDCFDESGSYLGMYQMSKNSGALGINCMGKPVSVEDVIKYAQKKGIQEVTFNEVDEDAKETLLENGANEVYSGSYNLKISNDPILSDVQESPKAAAIHTANVDFNGKKYTTEFVKSGGKTYCKIYKDGEQIFYGTTNGDKSTVYAGHEDESENIQKILGAVENEQNKIDYNNIEDAVKGSHKTPDDLNVASFKLNGNDYSIMFNGVGDFTIFKGNQAEVVSSNVGGKYVTNSDEKLSKMVYKAVKSKIFSDAAHNGPVIKNPDLHKKVTFPKSSYSKERKDAAMYWRAEGVGYSDKEKASNEAWKALSPVSSKAYLDSSNVAKKAGWAYTAGSGHFNRSLRGIPKGYDKTSVEEVNSLTDMISRSTYDKDMWLTRGIDDEGFFYYAGLDKPIWQYSDSDLQKLVGKEVKDEAFLSCSNVKGYGFKESVMLNIYCPKGTQALFAEPFSSYGYTASQEPPPYWDGKKKGSTGSEFETILQRGTTVKFTKIYREGGKLYVDCDVIAQEPREIEKSGKVIKVKGK